MMFPGHIWPASATTAKRKALASFVQAHDLRLTTLNRPNIDLNIGAAVPEVREYSIATIERTIMLAADVGAEGVIIGPGKPNPLLPASTDVMRSRFFEACDRFTRLGDRLGVQILLENMPVGFVCAAGDLVKLLDEYGAEQIGVVYDVANGAYIGEDFAPAVRALGPRFKFIHLSDTPKHSCRHDRIAGEGIVKFEEIGHALAKLEHDEPLIIEIISEQPDEDIASSILNLKACGWP